MTDNEIIKALECWLNEIIKSNQTSIDMGYEDIAIDTERYIRLMRETLDLINRQKEEIESLKVILNIVPKAKAEAIKEFAERVKNIDLYYCVEEYYENAELCYEVRDDWFDERIDNLVKEMAGDKK